jgi:hypothetical protein
LSASENGPKSEAQQSRMGMRLASESSTTESTNRGTVTGNIEFANVTGPSKKSSVTGKKTEVVSKAQGAYKLIDFGSAVGIHEDENTSGHDHENMMTATELEFAGYCLLNDLQNLIFAE